jgi:hypothetical protein
VVGSADRCASGVKATCARLGSTIAKASRVAFTRSHQRVGPEMGLASTNEGGAPIIRARVGMIATELLRQPSCGTMGLQEPQGFWEDRGTATTVTVPCR